MAAAHEQLSDGTNGADAITAQDDAHTDPADQAPWAFRAAVQALHSARLRPGIEIETVRAPRRLAPHAHAIEACVLDGDEDLADGRLILLYDPAGHEAWQGRFRLVTLVRAELEPEMAADPLLPDVCWSWLTGALDARGLTYHEAGGTVTRAASHYFGGLSERPSASQIEIRASWTPHESGGEVPDTAAHLLAWCELLCQLAGLPPAGSADGSVVSLPQRRGPQTH
ncbi:DUF3000 domain-containing protein [Streptomyces sp. NA04227]|uniref:DUF3000 domain-containing protein n=1 Tax=Streptomyces sp. NA04227 TaxID=2742136 RepID=UPI0015908C9B|nr:DUF3000 domain-containing protein [Streptomyces sp. NA04227]QKW09896.1 DUF3000 domain-containing protein [Streptomyces sp. NA04227]